MKAMIIILVVILFVIFFLNTFACSQSDSKFETVYCSIIIGLLFAFTLTYYSGCLYAYVEEKTIVKMENQEIKYEVTSIEPNTGKVLTIKLNEE